MGYSQMVKAADFDSVIGSSNLSTPTKYILLIYYYNNKLLMFRMPAHHNPDVVTSFSKSAMLHINIADFFYFIE